MTAFVAGGDFCTRFLGIEMIAANTVKGDFSPLRIVIFPVASIVIKPEDAKHPENQEAV